MSKTTLPPLNRNGDFPKFVSLVGAHVAASDYELSEDFRKNVMRECPVKPDSLDPAQTWKNYERDLQSYGKVRVAGAKLCGEIVACLDEGLTSLIFPAGDLHRFTTESAWKDLLEAIEASMAGAGAAPAANCAFSFIALAACFQAEARDEEWAATLSKFGQCWAHFVSSANANGMKAPPEFWNSL